MEEQSEGGSITRAVGHCTDVRRRLSAQRTGSCDQASRPECPGVLPPIPPIDLSGPLHLTGPVDVTWWVAALPARPVEDLLGLLYEPEPVHP